MWAVCTVTAIEKELGILVAGGKPIIKVVVYLHLLGDKINVEINNLFRRTSIYFGSLSLPFSR
jgi:hypothetical protein